MDDIRFRLKAKLVHEAPALVGKYWRAWATPDLEVAFLDARGEILCPLAIVNRFEQRPATQMHELFPWPFEGSKYHPEDVKPELAAAYYCRPLVTLVSPEMNQTVADSYSARLLLLRYNAYKYGLWTVHNAIRDLQALTRTTLEYELPIDLPIRPIVKIGP